MQLFPKIKRLLKCYPPPPRGARNCSITPQAGWEMQLAWCAGEGPVSRGHFSPPLFFLSLFLCMGNLARDCLQGTEGVSLLLAAAAAAGGGGRYFTVDSLEDLHA